MQIQHFSISFFFNFSLYNKLEYNCQQKWRIHKMSRVFWFWFQVSTWNVATNIRIFVHQSVIDQFFSNVWQPFTPFTSFAPFASFISLASLVPLAPFTSSRSGTSISWTGTWSRPRPFVTISATARTFSIFWRRAAAVVILRGRPNQWQRQFD